MGTVADGNKVYNNNPSPSAEEGLLMLRENQEAFKETFGVMPPEILVIKDDTIFPTTAICNVRAEGDASADDITTIIPTLSNGTTLHDGMVLLLSAKDASQRITLKNSAGQNGIVTTDGKDIVLSTKWYIILQFVENKWNQVNVNAPLPVASSTLLGGVKPQSGDGGLRTGPDGSLSVEHATETQRGSVLTSKTAKSGAVPVAGEDGKLDPSWVPTGLPLGYIYAWPYSTPMDGSIQINGQLLNRELYVDLFAYAKSHGQVISETEWQEKASQQGGYCNFYSEGDGSTTFRAPKIAPYKKLTMVSADAGKYYEAGLPDIEGTTGYDAQDVSGAFYGGSVKYGQAGTGGQRDNLSFKASLSNSIYGNSDTVRPESMDWIVCVVAFGVATNVGSVDVANVMTAVGQVQADIETTKQAVDKATQGLVEKGSRTSGGSITLTDCDPTKMLYMVAEGGAKSNQAGFLAYIRSGGAGINIEEPLGNYGGTARGYVKAIKIASDTVVIEFTSWTGNPGWTVKFYQ